MDLQVRGGCVEEATGLKTHATEVRNIKERERRKNLTRCASEGTP